MPFLGMRGTGDWSATGQRPENWRETILYLYPNGAAPLTAILSMLPSDYTTDPKFHWYQKLLPDQRATVTGNFTDALISAYVSGGLINAAHYCQMAEADADKFVAGHQVLLRDASALDVDVNAYVVAVVKNGADSYIQCKLMEADDNGATTDLSDCDVALIIGTIHSEGATSPDSLMYDPTEYNNQCQIFRTALEHTRTAMKTKLRTGPQVQQAKREALQLHSMEMEKSLIFGELWSSTGTNGKPMLSTRGVKRHLTTNYADYTKAAGTTTWLAGGEAWLDARFEELFRFGSQEKLFLCGSGALAGINTLIKAKGTFELTAMKTDYGINVLRWVTPHGTAYFKTHPLFSYEATTRNSMLGLEVSNLKYRYVDDTKYKPDIGENDLDGEKSEYLTEAGLEVHHERTHQWLDGVGLDNP